MLIALGRLLLRRLLLRGVLLPVGVLLPLFVPLLAPVAGVISLPRGLGGLEPEKSINIKKGVNLLNAGFETCFGWEPQHP